VLRWGVGLELVRVQVLCGLDDFFESCGVERVRDAGGPVAATADCDHGDGRVQLGQSCLQLPQGNVQRSRNHAFGDFKVLADIEDPGSGAALVGFVDSDFGHGVSFLNGGLWFLADGFAGLAPGAHAATHDSP
jgi:hypothetical protein